MMALLKPLETKTSPFTTTPKTNETPHWVRPQLVAQVKFTEWTADGKLRHPGLSRAARRQEGQRTSRAKDAVGVRVRRSTSANAAPRSAERRTTNERSTRNPERRNPTAASSISCPRLESARKDGVLTLPDGDELNVTNLHKVFWPKQKLTKGDLFRYYAQVAPFLLPAVADRPLVMKRFPNGIAAPPFYQHRAPDVPPGVRTEVVGVVEERPQIIGGSLKTLLYMTQLAAISQDPWFSRVAHPEFADHVALDLDPADGVPFARVLDVARWIRDELDALGATGVAEDVRRRRPAHLHPAAARHAVRGRPALLPDRRDARRAEASEGGDDRAEREGAGQARLRRLPAEHPRQDARDAPTARGRATTPACRRR